MRTQTQHLPGFRGWLLGGVSGMDFLVEPDGLTSFDSLSKARE